jgi:hypothetical protein
MTLVVESFRSNTSPDNLSQGRRSKMPLKPFNAWDYFLCALAYFLIGIAAVPKFASLVFGR